MSGESKIEWTDSTFNPWSLPETFASLQLSRVADAVRLEMPQFMAWVAQRHAIGHFVSKLRKFCERLLVVRAEVSSGSVAAVTAGVVVAGEHGIPPFKVLRRSPQAEIPLSLSVNERVVLSASRGALACYRSNPGFRLIGMPLAEPIGWPPLCRLAHLATRLFAHLGALHHHG